MIQSSYSLEFFFPQHQYFNWTLFFDKGTKWKQSLWLSRRETAGPQHTWVRSLFLQPTWQHVMVRMALMSRLLSWGLRLRFSRLLCSPTAKPGRTERKYVSVMRRRNAALQRNGKEKSTNMMWGCFFFHSCNRRPTTRAIWGPALSRHKETRNDHLTTICLLYCHFSLANQRELASNSVCLCFTGSKRERLPVQSWRVGLCCLTSGESSSRRRGSTEVWPLCPSHGLEWKR